MSLNDPKWRYLLISSINFSCKISLARLARAYQPSDFTAENSHFEGKNAFFATFSLFLASLFFLLVGIILTTSKQISKNMLLENMKKLRVGVNERRQIQSKLTEMLMVERQIDADSTNLAKTNKS